MWPSRYYKSEKQKVSIPCSRPYNQSDRIGRVGHEESPVAHEEASMGSLPSNIFSVWFVQVGAQGKERRIVIFNTSSNSTPSSSPS